MENNNHKNNNMLASTDTLKRYLRNFDPMNESLFKVPDTSSFAEDYSQDSVMAGAALNGHHLQPRIQEQNQNELDPFTSTEEQRNSSQVHNNNHRPTFEKQPVRYSSTLTAQAAATIEYQSLLVENKEMKNKLHMLAEHVSALQFENERMSEAMKKQHSRKNSAHTSSRKPSKENSSSNNHSKRNSDTKHMSRKSHAQVPSKKISFQGRRVFEAGGFCQRCVVINEQMGSVQSMLKKFMLDFSTLYLSSDSPSVSVPLCHSFQKVLENQLYPENYYMTGRNSNHNKIQSDSNPQNFMQQISETMLALFEQIDYITNKYTAIEEENHKQMKKYLWEIESLKEELCQYQNNQTVASICNESVNQLSVLLRIALKSETAKAQVLEFTELLKEKQQVLATINSLEKNLRDFRNGPAQEDNQIKYKKTELDFKEGLIQKEHSRLKKVTQKISSLHTKIVAAIEGQPTNQISLSSTVHNNDIASLLKSMREYPRTTHSSMAASINPTRQPASSLHQGHNTTAGGSLFQEILRDANKQNNNIPATALSDIRQMELNRQNSLAHLKEKIKQAQQSNKSIRKKDKEQGNVNSNNNPKEVSFKTDRQHIQQSQGSGNLIRTSATTANLNRGSSRSALLRYIYK